MAPHIWYFSDWPLLVLTVTHTYTHTHTHTHTLKKAITAVFLPVLHILTQHMGAPGSESSHV